MAPFDTTVANPAAPASIRSAGDCSMTECVQRALTNYFSQLGDQKPNELYGMVLEQVERPLLEAMMSYTKGNQSKAAIFLGISRGTLRKKLKIYDLE